MAGEPAAITSAGSAMAAPGVKLAGMREVESVPRTFGGVGLLFAMAGLLGCSGGLPSVEAPQPLEQVVEATPVVVTPSDAANVGELFERALALLSSGNATEAANLFDTIGLADTSGTYAPTALFNAGLAWELAGDPTLALARFEEARRRAPGEKVAKLSTIRALRLLGRQESWLNLSELSDALLARGDLTDLELLEGVGSKALALVELGELDAAERHIATGRSLIEALRLGEGGKPPTSAARVQFALGELRRLRSEKIVFVPLPGNFPDVLERRCQGLLDAQEAYTEAMRSMDPHWAAMSGYRVGQLYQRLHADVLAMNPPAQADTAEKRALFEGAIRLRFRVLLEKGLRMMDHTVGLGERTGEAPAWISRAREARDELLRSLANEKAALARLPYSEAELQRALDDLEKRARPSS